jgi:ABC-type branched-subunit amino acid transport system substrate-binding protein
MKKITSVILILFLSGVLAAQGDSKKPTSHEFKLGILYINSPTGKRFSKGISDAIKYYNSRNGKRFELPSEIPYINETDGVDKLVATISGKKADIILGPTESGVFIRALEQRKELEQQKIPVISSQVASKIPHQKGSWFFRTNINVERRVQVIYDYLNKYWVRSVAVIYEDTEFARRAEEAFRNELRGRQKELYLSLAYNSIDTARRQIRQILEKRPEAVGIFGNRSDFVHLFGLLKSLNTGLTNYFPLTFSVIDIRTVQGELFPEEPVTPTSGDLQDGNSVYFVSVTDEPKNKKLDDVEAIAYDTTMIVLRELETLAELEGFDYKSDSWRELFRSRFQSILNGNIEIGKGESNYKSKTGITFKNFENETTPQVFELNKNEPNPIKLEETIGFFEKIGHKVESIRKRFGDSPIILNLLIIILGVLFMSIKDIKRWWWGETLGIFGRRYFWFLFVVNFVIALTAYVYLAETGNIRYDSVLMALILSMTPSTVLHITLFETSTGKAIGLARYYDSFLQWIYDKMAIKNYLKNKAYVNVIAYQNSVYAMKSLFRDIYQDVHNKGQAIRMQTRIEDVLKKADSWIERRKAMALLVLRKFKWDELVDLNFIPEEFRGRGPRSDNHLIPYDDPENVVINAARACARDGKQKTEIEEEIDTELGKETPERQLELKGDYEKDKSEMKTRTAIMRKQIIFLTLLKEYKREYLERKCLSKKSKDILAKAVELWEKNEVGEDVVVEVNKEIKKLLANKADNKKEQCKITRINWTIIISGIMSLGGIISVWGSMPIWGIIFMWGLILFIWGLILRWGTTKIKEFKKEKEILENILLDDKVENGSFEKKIRYLLLHGEDEKFFKDVKLLNKTYEFIEPPENGEEETNGGKTNNTGETDDPGNGGKQTDNG